MEEGNFIKVFKEEALELLGSLEDSLLELENSPEDPDLISAVFRVMHTIKGSAGMVGLDNISTFTHEVESILEQVRSGVIQVSKGFIDYTLKSRDIILQLLNDPDFILENSEEFFDEFKKSLRNEYIPVKVIKKVVTYRIFFNPDPDIFLTGTNPLIMVNEVLELGEGVVIPCYSQIPSISDINIEKCYISWEIYVTTSESVNKIHDIFIFLTGDFTLKVEEWNIDVDDNNPERLGDLLVRRGVLEHSELQVALERQHKLGEILITDDILTKHEVNNALKVQNFIKGNKLKKVESITSDSIRINSNKLDGLVDLVGEIVTIYAQMLQMSHESNDNKLISIIERFGLLTEELRDSSMSMRMLPIGSTFSRFRRLVRDLSADLGKNINLITEGADTELDKNVIEQLHDPLVHIIRNSIDHGIECPDERIKNGKEENGTITLRAIHAGASVHIIIEDNGGGLNKDRIREKAISRGLLQKDEGISDKDLFSLIFAPGFSTAKSVTNVSGRGVGLDVVKKQIEQLKGSVFIDSQEGEFTRFTLIIPITLAIIEGLLVKIDKDFFVIPLSTVEACVEIKDPDKVKNGGRNIITFRDKFVPYVDLRTFFDINSNRLPIEQIVIVNINNNQIGLLVDSVVGSNQTVIKSLGSMYNNVKEISGAAIMGNGSVALVLDVEKLVRTVEDIEEVSIGL